LPASVIPRPELTGRILATDPGGTCVLCAAPGYGATTALVQAMAGSADRVFWVSLEGEVSPEQAQELVAAATGADTVELDAVLDRLESAGSCWLVVDGLDPKLHAGLAADLQLVAGRLPASARMAIATQSRFGPVARAVTLDEAQLEFDTDEAFELVSTMVPGLEIEDATSVIRAAEGWVRALVAGAAHLHLHGSGDWLPAGGATELFGDWFTRLPSAQQDFLYTTAVLDALAAEPAAAVSGQPDAAAILLELEAAHAYVRPIPAPPGHGGRWWHRHGLLSAYLRQRSGTDRVARNSAAADWFIEAGDVTRAMHHLTASGRHRDAGEFLTRHESELFSTGQADQILQWYDQIAVTAEDRIVHLLRVGWGQALSRDIRGADATLARLSAALTEHRTAIDAERELTDPAQGGWWVADEALLRAYLAAIHADPATMVTAGRRAQDMLVDTGTRDAMQLAPMLVMRGLVWSGQTQAATRLLQSTIEMPFPNDLLRESHLAGVRALIEYEHGEVNRAAVHAAAALRWLDRAGLDPFEVLQFSPLLASASVSLDRGDPLAALDRATRTGRAAEAIGHHGDAAWASLIIARVHTVQGDYGAALRSLSHARNLAVSETPDSAMAVPLDQAQALVHLAAGDAVRAERLIRRLPPGDVRSLLWARSGLARQPALARRTLEGIQTTMPRVEAERHLLLACVYLKTSRRMAQGHLRKAARIAHANGLGQLLSPPEPGMVELAHDTGLEFQDDDLLWLTKARRAPDSGVPTSDASLSRGEMQLLSLLPTRAKNAEIADNLCISINTVKTRLRRLYFKLGAANRDEAIEIARTRGLLHRS
jgi:LuxR family maltose regulon positive regulatory protein